jgi:hypothetical protein
MTENWVCIGHSHVAAFQHAAIDSDLLDPINFWDTGEPWVRGNGSVRLRPDLAERISSRQHVLSLIGGSAHTVLGVVEHPRPFDFVLPSAPRLPVDQTREIVPAEAVRAKLYEMAMPYLENLTALLAVARGPVLQIEPPPPVADEERIRRFMPWDMFPGQPREIAPKWMRYKLWRMHVEVIRTICSTFGVNVMAAPKAAMDADGFLANDYDQDGAHANGAYGALLFDTLRQAA